MRRLGVPFYARHAFVSGFVPKDFAGHFVEAEQAPLMRLFLGVGDPTAVQSHFQLRLRARLYGGSDVDAIFPNDRACVAQSGNGRLPSDVLTVFESPTSWQCPLAS